MKQGAEGRQGWLVWRESSKSSLELPMDTSLNICALAKLCLISTN